MFEYYCIGNIAYIRGDVIRLDMEGGEHIIENQDNHKNCMRPWIDQIKRRAWEHLLPGRGYL